MNTQTAVLTPSFRKRRGSSRIFPFSLISALLYIAFFLIGFPLCKLFPVFLSPKSCLTLRNFLNLLAIQGSFSEVAAASVACARWDAVLLALLFMLAFSYFCDLSATLLLSYRAFTVGLALGAADMLFRTGEISLRALTAFLCTEALVSALLIGYATLSRSLSRRLRSFGRRQALLSLLCAILHLVRLAFFTSAVFILYFSVHMITA